MDPRGSLGKLSLVDGADGVDGAGGPLRSREPDGVTFSRAVFGPAVRSAVLRVMDSGWVTSGPEVLRFEREFARYVDAEFAVAVSSCTAALEISLRGLRLAPQASVLLPTTTFCGALNAVLHAGLAPVLVDVDPVTGNATSDTVHRALAAGVRPAAMVALHLGGYPAPVAELAEAADLPLSRVVEDAAHAVGTSVGDRPVGGAAAAACFSFYATKNLAIGEGGMVTTNDAHLAETARRLRQHGMSRDAWRRYLPGGSWRYDVEEPGLKANLTDVQAVIGRVLLRELPSAQRRRQRVAGRYRARLEGTRGVTVPEPPTTGRHGWHLYAVAIDPRSGHTRDEVAAALSRRGVETSVHFIPLHRMTAYRAMAATVPGGFPGAEARFERTLSPPFDQHLTDIDVDLVCAELARVMAS